MINGNLVGGNIEGLHTIGTSLSSANEPLASAHDVLNNAVDRVVHDSGWYGNAAKAMREAWAVDTTEVGVLAEATSWCGRAVTELAASLEALNRQLHDAAYQAPKAGVRIAPDGSPLPLSSADSLVTVYASGQYSATRRRLLDEAQSARGLAYARLSALGSALDEPLSHDPSARTWVQAQNLLRGLYTAPDRAAEITRDAGLQDLAGKLCGSHEMRTGVKALPGFLKGIPILSWASTGVSAGLKTYDDVQHGWNPAAAAAVDYGSGIAGTLAGAANDWCDRRWRRSGRDERGGNCDRRRRRHRWRLSGERSRRRRFPGLPRELGARHRRTRRHRWCRDRYRPHSQRWFPGNGYTVKSVGDVAGSLWKGLTGH